MIDGLCLQEVCLWHPLVGSSSGNDLKLGNGNRRSILKGNSSFTFLTACSL